MRSGIYEEGGTWEELEEEREVGGIEMPSSYMNFSKNKNIKLNKESYMSLSDFIIVSLIDSFCNYKGFTVHKQICKSLNNFFAVLKGAGLIFENMKWSCLSLLHFYVQAPWWKDLSLSFLKLLPNSFSSSCII